IRLEPGDEVDVPTSLLWQAGPPLLHAAIPRTHVLADVAPVHLCAERCAEVLGDRVGCLRPVGETARRIERPGLVERAGWARVDAEPAGAAVRLEPRRRLELDVGHERAEDDPRS